MTDQSFDGAQRWIELGVGKSETRLVLFTSEGQADRIGSFTGLVSLPSRLFCLPFVAFRGRRGVYI